jgi:hypothetical protein
MDRAKQSPQLLVGLFPTEKGSILILSGPLRDAFILMVTLLLYESPDAPILRCPECQTIFYRVCKQQYCSRLCVNRVGVRRHRAKKKGQKNATQQSRTRYERQARKTTGSTKSS